MTKSHVIVSGSKTLTDLLVDIKSFLNVQDLSTNQNDKVMLKTCTRVDKMLRGRKTESISKIEMLDKIMIHKIMDIWFKSNALWLFVMSHQANGTLQLLDSDSVYTGSLTLVHFSNISVVESDNVVATIHDSKQVQYVEMVTRKAARTIQLDNNY